MKTDLLLSQPQACDLLLRRFPELKERVKYNLKACSAYKFMLEFAAYSQELIDRHDFRQLKRCLQMADRLHRTGERALVNAIENVYVFALQFEYDRETAAAMRQLLPDSLRRCYYRMVSSSLP